MRELKRQFDSGLYERLALSRDKDGIRQMAHFLMELGKEFLFQAPPRWAAGGCCAGTA